MKKITLLLCLLAINIIAFSQNVPCPDIQSHGFANITTVGSTCTSKVYAFATGDIAANKSLNIKVYIGNAVTGTLIADNCFLVPGGSASTVYETSAFSAPCSATITYVLARSTNAVCGGTTCGTTITIDGGPLPINLTSFFAKRTNGKVSISWKTASEINAKSFVIQRNSGSGFIDIATISAGNNINGSSYFYTDNNNNKTVSQYRIKMLDIDGSFKNSDTRIVKGNADFSDFTVFPNPSNGNTKVSITDISDPTDVQLIDNTGRMLKTVSLNNTNTIEFNNLNNGTYIIRIINKNSGESSTKKLSVIN